MLTQALSWTFSWVKKGVATQHYPAKTWVATSCDSRWRAGSSRQGRCVSLTGHGLGRQSFFDSNGLTSSSGYSKNYLSVIVYLPCMTSNWQFQFQPGLTQQPFYRLLILIEFNKKHFFSSYMEKSTPLLVKISLKYFKSRQTLSVPRRMRSSCTEKLMCRGNHTGGVMGSRCLMVPTLTA